MSQGLIWPQPRRAGKSYLIEQVIEYCRANRLRLLIHGADGSKLLTEDGKITPLLRGEIGTIEWFRVIESGEFAPPRPANKSVANSYGPPARGRGGKIKRW